MFRADPAQSKQNANPWNCAEIGIVIARNMQDGSFCNA